MSSSTAEAADSVLASRRNPAHRANRTLRCARGTRRPPDTSGSELPTYRAGTLHTVTLDTLGPCLAARLRRVFGGNMPVPDSSTRGGCPSRPSESHRQRGRLQGLPPQMSPYPERPVARTTRAYPSWASIPLQGLSPLPLRPSLPGCGPRCARRPPKRSTDRDPGTGSPRRIAESSSRRNPSSGWADRVSAFQARIAASVHRCRSSRGPLHRSLSGGKLADPRAR